MHGSLLVQLLILLVVANGTAVVAKKILGDCAWPPPRWRRSLCRWRTPLRALENHPRRRSVFVGDIHLRGADESRMADRKPDRDLRHCRRSFSSFVKRRMRLASSSMAIGLDHIPESSFPFWPANAAATGYSRYCHWGYGIRGGRSHPVPPPFQVKSARRAVLTVLVSAKVEVVRVISGGQLKRTGTTDDPAPTDV